MDFQKISEKMRAEKISEAAINSFERSYRLLIEKKTSLIPESELTPVISLPKYEELPKRAGTRTAPSLDRCALLKLNGGLGTSMGLEKVKSLLTVKENMTFLDLIARQVNAFRSEQNSALRFLLMNSFSTSEDTREWLSKNPTLGSADETEVMQSMAPKIDAATFEAISWPQNPALEWCPPGHGDLYAALAGDRIKALLKAGVEYLFVSNADNLGASLDFDLYAWFVESGAPFAMEVTARTPSDRKGGHLALRNGKLTLRESAQCADEDTDAFQDISKYRYFNTNNLWLHLPALSDALAKNGGFLPLPVIQNRKTVDPRDKTTPAVYHLETAMGAAIECFGAAQAIDVPRSRFAPVKTTSDLFALRSDAYLISKNGQVQLHPDCGGVPPVVKLDENYKLVDQLESALDSIAPSLQKCKSLTVAGPVFFESGVIFEGEVEILNPSSKQKNLPAGTYTNIQINL
ncbi:MAG: UTP--glucose-1-phosphate uridylyltransferase [Chthoniobacterales bacterium]